MGQWLLRARVALWEARAEGVARWCKGVWARLHAGLLVIERGHENKPTWPLRETPLEGVQTFRGKGHLLSQGQTAEIVWVKSVK